jgi:hypothetical protein
MRGKRMFPLFCLFMTLVCLLFSCETLSYTKVSFGVTGFSSCDELLCTVELFYPNQTYSSSDVAYKNSFTISSGSGSCVLNKAFGIVCDPVTMSYYDLRIYIDVDRSGEISTGDYYFKDDNYCILSDKLEQYGKEEFNVFPVAIAQIF